MQSEDFDNKVRNAAEHHHPAYDESAWEKMEQLLDKHLPQEKDDRKRRFLFILLFLLTGGTAGLMVLKPWQKNKTIVAVKQEVPVAAQQPADHQNNTTTIKTSTGTTEAEDQINKQNTTAAVTTTATAISSTSGTIASVSTSREMPVDKTKKEQAVLLKNRKTFSSFTNGAILKEKISNKNKIADNNTLQQDVKPAVELQQPLIAAAAANNNKTILTAGSAKNIIDPVENKVTGDTEKDSTASNNITEAAKIDAAAIAGIIDSTANNKTSAKKTTAKKKNSFFFSVSAGPDVSFAGSGKTGTAKLLTGAGLGYTFHNKLTIRTGFYAARKIYSASAAAYHPPANFYTYYPYLQKVNADCKVYEIPLLISWSFGRSSKQHWFASTGLSSYLMKSEVYNYDYKTTYSGPTMKGKWTVNNQNKHFFSVVNLSGGYQRNLNKHISLIIEPYVKLPLTGVGYGKVKLNSGGILFTVGIKPFK